MNELWSEFPSEASSRFAFRLFAGANRSAPRRVTRMLLARPLRTESLSPPHASSGLRKCAALPEKEWQRRSRMHKHALKATRELKRRVALRSFSLRR
jgi:hypothetical protein